MTETPFTCKAAWRRENATHHYAGSLSGSRVGLRLAGPDPATGIDVTLMIPAAAPEREQAQYLALALRERVLGLAALRLGVGEHQAGAQRGMDVAAAGGHLAHRLDELRVRRLLQHVARGAGRERLAHVVRVVLHRE